MGECFSAELATAHDYKKNGDPMPVPLVFDEKKFEDETLVP